MYFWFNFTLNKMYRVDIRELKDCNLSWRPVFEVANRDIWISPFLIWWELCQSSFHFRKFFPFTLYEFHLNSPSLVLNFMHAIVGHNTAIIVSVGLFRCNYISYRVALYGAVDLIVLKSLPCLRWMLIF